MSALLIQQGEWVVVCDGPRHWCWRYRRRQIPNLKTVEVFEQKDLATHELGTERPGRPKFGRPRPQRGRADRLARPGRTGLLGQLVKHLDAALTAGKTKTLIIVAPPRALA